MNIHRKDFMQICVFKFISISKKEKKKIIQIFQFQKFTEDKNKNFCSAAYLCEWRFKTGNCPLSAHLKQL
jgi:hypothetical protein